MRDLTYTIVVPTVGRPTLHRLLASVGVTATAGPPPQEIVVVVDGDASLPGLPSEVRLLRSPGRGPAAARNVGWRAAAPGWVVFLDDDVVVTRGWATRLADDLAVLDDETAGSQGRIRVPLPVTRRASDWERSTAALEGAQWATADMAYRRAVLAEVGGFDERFPRAYREDAEIALRITGAGYAIARGRRSVIHPVRPATFLTSVRVQAGNADDALMRRLHGRGWRNRANAATGRLRRHAAITTAGLAGLVGACARSRPATMVGLLGWALGTAEFATARIAPGPRSGAEITRMLVTSVLIPPVAVWHRLRGEFSARTARPLPLRPAAVVFDRDGTLVRDVPYNGNPDAVVPMPGAADAVRELRRAGIPVGVVTNQSGVAAGRITRAEVDKVNARIDELVGPFDVWCICPHGPGAGCRCRKPRAGLVEDAARALDVPARRVVVVGDIGADVEAARAAGARGILVPSAATEPAEIAAAQTVVPDLASAVQVILGQRPTRAVRQ